MAIRDVPPGPDANARSPLVFYGRRVGRRDDDDRHVLLPQATLLYGHPRNRKDIPVGAHVGKRKKQSVRHVQADGSAVVTKPHEDNAWRAVSGEVVGKCADSRTKLGGRISGESLFSLNPVGLQVIRESQKLVVAQVQGAHGVTLAPSVGSEIRLGANPTYLEMHGQRHHGVPAAPVREVFAVIGGR